MADIQDLLARLNSQAAASGGGSSGNQSGYQHPTVSSPLFSPTPTGPQPHHQSAVISPNTSAANTPGPEQSSADRQNSLLNLLRFNVPTASQQGGNVERSQSLRGAGGGDGAIGHGRTTSASDLVASFMRKPSYQGPTDLSASATSAPPANPESFAVPKENPQDLLLRLLNHPKPSVESSSSKLPETTVDDDDDEALDDPRFDTERPKKPVFTYVNPFEQLSAATPRNRTPAPETSKPAPPKIEILKSKHTRDVSPTTHSRKASPGSAAQTVSSVVADIGEQVEKQVEEVLAQAEEDEANGNLTNEVEALSLSKEEAKEIEEAIHDTAVEIKKELEDEDNKQAFEEVLPKPIADALKEVVDEVAQVDVADSWESAEAEGDLAKDDEQTVYVYRFPMRAFASITVKGMPERALSLRSDSIMDIARLKKEFDQIDRALVTASKNFIVYAVAKNGGFRIIRQENGSFRQVFQTHAERIFNVAICAAPAGLEPSDSPESILAIGVNGSVLWTSLVPSRQDQIDDLDAGGLILPPSPAQDDNTSGGQLKTRAKPSSRHPEFFAVGRGKSIHIIFPKVAESYVRSKGRLVNTEKYLKERSLKILTGKAGKDFSFSEDDTVIVSLDKAGRMRFWDIRSLTNEELGDPNSPAKSVEISQTLLEFPTTGPTSKCWPTSVFFLDKDKPFNKGIALRYVMVGMKQNHTFQLWDLGLGKAVQEINLPHEKESDAICSVAFHPRTGILVVGHPTRNSIYFIYVSLPRYNLPVLSQAGYLARLANKGDRSQPPLPPVAATAIMTTITEYSFAPKGQLRSLHMLNEPLSPSDVDEPDNNALFELYVMHAKGVCSVAVRRSDLGWKREGEPLHPIEAEEEGIISIAMLKPPAPAPSDETSTSGDTPAPKASTERSVRESIKKESSSASRQSMTPEAAMRASTLAKVESKQDAARAAIINGGEKTEKKKKKRAGASADNVSQTTSTSKPSSYVQAAQAPQAAQTPLVQETPVETVTTTFNDSTETPEWAKSMVSQILQKQSSAVSASAEPDSKQVGEVVQVEVSKGLSRELDILYKRLEEDRRVQDAASAAKQEAVLRLVSSTLTENVDKTLVRMVDDSVRNVLLPQVMSTTVSTVEKNISQAMKISLETNLAKALPETVARAMKDPHVVGALSDQISKKVMANIDTLIRPAFANLSAVIERQIGDQLRQAQAQRANDVLQIGQLTDMVAGLTQTVHTMAASHGELLDQVVKLQENISQLQSIQLQSKDGSVTVSSPRTARSPSKQPKSPVQLEAEAITRLMAEGNYEQGTMMWLQSTHTAELFDRVFVSCNPAYLSQVSTLLALSTGAVVTESLETHLAERMIWLEAVLSNVNPRDPEILDIIPRIMEVLNQRLTAAYISLNETSPGHKMLRKISTLVNKVNELARQVPAARHE
ncbi:hypothetical protein GQ43DRAFT_315222 [Delitschia confertaspora ATCC 74209]|uniref:EDC4-like protein pdc1 beta-propeller domain-containing protein n=1 Tax=Delitschia confertaspora ATCC 74209 TaxID=1513339 RepID=A0A9P4MZW9_9PLEO|nr:hypothetical protein GQ43DRAFT_315222 [Delitschia confertaspora ATCC 74209]